MVIDAKVKKREALAFMGYAGQDIDPALESRLDAAIQLCEKELTAKGIYKIIGAEEALSIFPGESIRRHLHGCSKVALLAVTLGASSEMLIKREAAINPTDGLLMDACASSMTEQAAKSLKEILENEAAKEGLACTHRFSPGYGDLPLSCQPEFLKACGASKALGIRANEANLLVPAKSITAIVGLRPKE